MAVPVGESVRVEVRAAAFLGVERHQFGRVDDSEHEVCGALELWVRRVWKNDESALLLAAACPVGHRHFERVADRAFRGAAGGEWLDQFAAVAEKRDVA